MSRWVKICYLEDHPHVSASTHKSLILLPGTRGYPMCFHDERKQDVRNVAAANYACTADTKNNAVPTQVHLFRSTTDET